MTKVTTYQFFRKSDRLLEDYSTTLHPLLDEVQIIHQDDLFRYRALIFRGGYEHVTGYLVIQKYSVNHNGENIPYELISSVSIPEINKIYNFGIETIKQTEKGIIIILNATHSYLYEETEITILLFENMDYEILSGLIEL